MREYLNRNPTTRVMAPKRDDQQQLRSTVGKDVYAVLKRLAGVRGVTLNQVVSEALDRYLESEDIREEIEYHKLEGREGE